MSEKNLFERIAKEHNTTAESVREEILYAFSCGHKNAPEKWENIKGSLEEQILHLASLSLATI